MTLCIVKTSHVQLRLLQITNKWWVTVPYMNGMCHEYRPICELVWTMNYTQSLQGETPQL